MLFRARVIRHDRWCVCQAAATRVSGGTGRPHDAVWRCRKVDWSAAGELHRCSVRVHKYRWQQHAINGPTSLRSRRLMIDPGFPDQRPQNRTSETMEKVFEKFSFETAEIVGRPEIPIRVIAS
jgi:hypothetical protein